MFCNHLPHLINAGNLQSPHRNWLISSCVQMTIFTKFIVLLAILVKLCIGIFQCGTIIVDPLIFIGIHECIAWLDMSQFALFVYFLPLVTIDPIAAVASCWNSPCNRIVKTNIMIHSSIHIRLVCHGHEWPTDLKFSGSMNYQARIWVPLFMIVDGSLAETPETRKSCGELSNVSSCYDRLTEIAMPTNAKSTPQ